MSVIDFIILGIGTIIIPGALYSLALLGLSGAFDKKNKEIVDNKEAKFGHNRIDYRFTTSSSIEKWIDSYEKKV